MSTTMVFNPLGRAASAHASEMPRLTDLSGKKLTVLVNTKQNALELLVGVAERLQERHPGLIFDVRRKESSTLPADPAMLTEITKEADVVLTGSGD